MLKAGLIFLMFASVANARMRSIAVIDTGYSGTKANICSTGSYDFIENRAGVGSDVIVHGTKVADTIAKGNSDYCLYIMKVFGSDKTTNDKVSKAIFLAIQNHADIINLSLEGNSWDSLEYSAINLAISKGIKVFVASGNHSINLNISCKVYPACYRILGMYVVGTLESGTVANYGTVVTHKEAWCSEGLCGTSLSTAIATGKYLKGLK